MRIHENGMPAEKFIPAGQQRKGKKEKMKKIAAITMMAIMGIGVFTSGGCEKNGTEIPIDMTSPTTAKETTEKAFSAVSDTRTFNDIYATFELEGETIGNKPFSEYVAYWHGKTLPQRIKLMKDKYPERFDRYSNRAPKFSNVENGRNIVNKFFQGMYNDFDNRQGGWKLDKILR